MEKLQSSEYIDVGVELESLRLQLSQLKFAAKARLELQKVVYSAYPRDEISSDVSSDPHTKDSIDYIWDAPRDTRYAHEVAGFENVLYVFHKHWEGIRAACGSLPGRKLALTDALLSPEKIFRLVEEIISASPSRIVFHGVSQNTGLLCRALSSQGLAEIVSIVFHGSLSQWCNEPERRLAFLAIDLKAGGHVGALHFMKAGIEIPGVNLHYPMLFNLSPRLESLGLPIIQRPEQTTAFIPGWGSWIKNVYNSALGAALNEDVQRVVHFASNLELPLMAGNKLEKVVFKSREDTFLQYATSTFAMNVSLTDCHPMVNVESQTLGRPCIRSNLFLDALEEHPYLKVTTVENPNSPVAIRETITRLLKVPSDEAGALAADYQSETDKVGISRYKEFLKLG